MGDACWDVLIVEDDENLRGTMALCFERAGYRTLVASEGGEALRLLETGRPRVILCDLWMPGMGGREFLRLVRERSDLDGIPVFLMTHDERACQLEADGLLQKPMRVADLVALAARHCKAGDRAPPLGAPEH
jgi:CheY-like chemotaxis protein